MRKVMDFLSRNFLIIIRVLIGVFLIIFICCFFGPWFIGELEVKQAERIEQEQVLEAAPDMLQIVASDSSLCIDYLRDLTTDVMYMKFYQDGYRKGAGGLTVMLHPDGSPLLYSDWINFREVSSDD